MQGCSLREKAGEEVARGGGGEKQEEREEEKGGGRRAGRRSWGAGARGGRGLGEEAGLRQKDVCRAAHARKPMVK